MVLIFTSVIVSPEKAFSSSDDSDRPVVKLIKRFEYFSPTVYLDGGDKGNPTIGYGHLIKPSETTHYTGKHLTEAEATALLRLDIRNEAEVPISRVLEVDLSSSQLDALTSLCFNIGQGHFESSDVLKKVNAGDTNGAYEYFNHWRRTKGVITPGLIKRRFAELFIFANKKLEASDDRVPSAQWKLPSMLVTDENWGMIGRSLRDEAVEIYEEYKGWSGK